MSALLPTQPGALPPPPDQPAASAPSSRRPWIIAAAVVVAGSLVVAVVMSRGGPWWPDRIAGFDRLKTDEAQRFEDVATDRTGDVRMFGAAYGTNGTVKLLVERFDGTPADFQFVPLDSFFGGAVVGFKSAVGDSASIDESAAATTSDEEASYKCAQVSFTGTGSTLFDSSPTSGAICAWKGDTMGLVVTLDGGDLNEAFTETEAAYAALHAPH